MMEYGTIISLISAIVGWGFAGILLGTFKPSVSRNQFAILSTFFGLQQFAEFMTCTASMPFVWAALGFSVYSFIPALGLDAVVSRMGNRQMKILLYIIPIIAMLFAILYPSFIEGTYCGTYALQVKNFFDGNYTALALIFKTVYAAYFVGFLLAMMIYSIVKSLNSKSATYAISNLLISLGVLFSGALALLSILAWPGAGVMLPSILGHSMTILVVFGFFACWIEER